MLESGYASGAFLQTTTPILDKDSGPMHARFLSSVELGFGTRIGRTQLFPTPALDKSISLRRTQGGCGGLGGEIPAAFPQARPIFQQPFSLPENAQTLAVIAFHAAGKSVNNFPAASKFARKLFQQGILDSHSLLEFSDSQRKIRNLKRKFGGDFSEICRGKGNRALAIVL